MAAGGLRRSSTRTYRPFGATFVVTADDERFHRAARFALARYPVTAGLSRGVHVALTATSFAGPEPTWPMTRMTETPQRLGLTSGASTLAVERSGTGSIADLRLEVGLLDEDHAVRVFVEAAFWWTVIGGGRLHAVHSGLVVRRGVGVLLRGQSGAGKSTLTYACSRLGMRVVSDDWVYAVADTDGVTNHGVTNHAVTGPLLHGSPWLVWLTTDGAARFPELSTVAAVAHPGSDRVKIPVRPPIGRRRISAVPDVVVFVEPSDTVRLHPIDPAEARERFGVSALDSERDSLPDTFVSRLLDRPVVVLGRGASPEAAAQALDRLVAAHASSRPAINRR